MLFLSVYPEMDLVQLHLLHSESHHVQLVVVGQRCFDFQSLTVMSDLYVGYCKFQALKNIDQDMKMLRLRLSPLPWQSAAGPGWRRRSPGSCEACRQCGGSPGSPSATWSPALEMEPQSNNPCCTQALHQHLRETPAPG